MLNQFKILPSVAYLRVERQVFVGYSMPLAGWIGEYLINYQGLPRPSFLGRAMRKLGFSFAGESRDEGSITQFFTKGSVSISASWDVERESLFLQIIPLRSKLSKGLTVRAENIEFYDQFVVSIEPAEKLPPGVRGIGIRALILEDFYPIEVPYWGMLHEDWESELNLIVMKDEVYDSLEREEYRCPVCFSPLSEENGVLKCTRCGFVYAPETDFDRVVESFSVEEFVF
ncbi:hypothetical protein [Thermococcus sp.]